MAIMLGYGYALGVSAGSSSAAPSMIQTICWNSGGPHLMTTTAKDANGVEIKAGDIVRHRIMPSASLAAGDGWHSFGGNVEVTRIIGDAHVECRKLRVGIPVYCSANVVKV